MQSWKMHFSSAVVFEEDSDDLVMTLLQGNGQRSETILVMRINIEMIFKLMLTSNYQTSVARLGHALF